MARREAPGLRTSEWLIKASQCVYYTIAIAQKENTLSTSRDSLDLVIVAVDPNSISAELANITNSKDLTELLVNLVSTSDARVRNFPLPFPNVLNSNLVPFFARGVLYSAGFHRDSTLTMTVVAETGGVVHLEAPPNISELAPGLTNDVELPDGATEFTG